MALKIFVDFDGTITLKDVGDTLFLHFGGAEVQAAIDAYHAGRISARECFLRKASASGVVTVADLNHVLDEQRLDPWFKDFVQYCREHGIELTILSDGLDYYIDRILARNGIHGVPRVSNLLTLAPVKDGTAQLALEFPAENSECDRCACCKRNIMLSRSGEEDFVVYVGEGYSDRCPAAYADLVFAKETLQTHCQRENISYLPYTTFADVRRGIETLQTRKHLRPRRSAMLRRTAAFLAE